MATSIDGLKRPSGAGQQGPHAGFVQLQSDRQIAIAESFGSQQQELSFSIREGVQRPANSDPNFIDLRPDRGRGRGVGVGSLGSVEGQQPAAATQGGAVAPEQIQGDRDQPGIGRIGQLPAPVESHQGLLGEIGGQLGFAGEPIEVSEQPRE
jgi:hypothetical protein